MKFNKEQRELIVTTFSTKHGKQLIKEFKDILIGKHERHTNSADGIATIVRMHEEVGANDLIRTIIKDAESEMKKGSK